MVFFPYPYPCPRREHLTSTPIPIPNPKPKPKPKPQTYSLTQTPTPTPTPGSTTFSEVTIEWTKYVYSVEVRAQNLKGWSAWGSATSAISPSMTSFSASIAGQWSDSGPEIVQ